MQAAYAQKEVLHSTLQESRRNGEGQTRGSSCIVGREERFSPIISLGGEEVVGITGGQSLESGREEVAGMGTAGISDSPLHVKA